jgi:hypothetical protein
LGLKDLRVKSSRINELRCQRALKMVLGQLRGASSWRTHLKTAPIRFLFSRATGCKSINFGRGQNAVRKLREIQSMVRDSRQRVLEAWNEFFGIVGA